MRRAALLVALVPAAAGAGEPSLTICGVDPARESSAAAELDRWVATAAVRAAAACPPAAASAWVGRFRARDGAVFFELEAPGRRLERRVPWLADAARPLASLGQQGRLSELSVLVESLLAEQRVLLELDALDPPPSQPPATKASPQPATRPRPRRASPPTPAPPEPAPEPGGPSLPPPDLSELASGDRRAALPEEPPPPGGPSASVAPGGTRGVVDFAEPPPRAPGAELQLGLESAWRLRSPGAHGLEIGARASYGPAFVRVAWQPPAELALDGRDLSLDVFGVAAGVELALLRREAWSIGGELAAVAERMGVRALYAADARTQRWWEAGASAGLRFRIHPGWGIQGAAAAGIQVLPTAASRLTHLGSDGPAAPLNAVAGRFGLELGVGL